MRTLSVALLAVAVVACQKAPSLLDSTVAQKTTDSTTTTADRADAPTHKPGASALRLSGLGGSADDRLARIEKRLDKVVEILDGALPPSEPDPMATYSVPVDAIDPVEGPADAKITIIEGFEFLCPYCYMVNPTVEQILQKYPKDVRVVAKYLVIHGQPALPPGMMACAAAKQGKYSAMKAALWSHLFKLENGNPAVQRDQVDPAALRQIATDVGLDMTRLDGDMKDCQKWLTSSEQELRPLGANGTPAFFINGRFLNGAQPLEKFDAVIKEELAKADKAIADGTSQADFYNKVVVAKGEKKVRGHFDD